MYVLIGVGLAAPHNTTVIWDKYKDQIDKVVSTVKVSGYAGVDLDGAIEIITGTNNWKQVVTLGDVPSPGFALHASATSAPWYLPETFHFGGNTAGSGGKLIPLNSLVGLIE